MKELPHITLHKIDAEHLEDLDDNPEAVQFTVHLSDTPHEDWIEEFETAYQNTLYPVKPPVIVDGDTLRVTFLPRYRAELQGFVNLLAQLAATANEEVRVTHEMRASGAQEQRRVEMREALKQVTLPPSG